MAGTAPDIERVIYPGLESHPQHDLAKRQMTGGFGGIISAEVKGGLAPARKMLERTRLFTLAESAAWAGSKRDRYRRS